jgi:RHS repeat-associated protein
VDKNSSDPVFPLAAIDRYAATTATNPVATTQYTYDAYGRLGSIDHTGTASGSTFAESHDYDYDALNRIQSYTNTVGYVGYTYDDRGQLLSTSGSSYDAYEYDANGNRVESSDNSGWHAYTIDDANQLDSNGEFTYQYDNEGNLIRRTDIASGDYTGFEWDHRNRLTSVVRYDANGTPTNEADDTITHEVNYYYDAFNQLVTRVEDPDGADTNEEIDQTFYFYDQGQVALEFHKTGTESLEADDLAHRYLWGPAVDQLLADEQVDWSDEQANGEVLWALTDQLGSVRDVVDSNGDLRVHRRFDAFGNIVNETHYDDAGATVDPWESGYVDVAFAFTGRYLDPDTGLQNNLNRWYDSTTGRWISEDPIGFAGGDSNLYRYVSNSPTDRKDPSGLASPSPGYGALPNPFSPSPQKPKPNPQMNVSIGLGEDDVTNFAEAWNASPALGSDGSIHIDPNNPNWPQAINDLNRLVPPGCAIKTLTISGHGRPGKIGPFNSAAIANDPGLQAFLAALNNKISGPTSLLVCVPVTPLLDRKVSNS